MTRLRTGLTHWANNQVHGLDDSILLRHQFSPNFSIDSVHSQLKYWQNLQKILQVESIINIWKCKGPIIDKTSLKKNKVGGITLLDFKFYFKAIYWNLIKEGFCFFFLDFPGSAVVKNLPAKAGDTGSVPGPRRSYMPRSN